MKKEEPIHSQDCTEYYGKVEIQKTKEGRIRFRVVGVREAMDIEVNRRKNIDESGQ